MSNDTRVGPKQLVVGTRTSRLARWQSAYVVRLLGRSWPDWTCTLRPFETKGDRTLDRPLPDIGGKGLFTAELEQALLSGEIDLAVHSLKDLPVDSPPGLTIGAIPEREDVSDVLVASGNHTMASLPPGATVGTSSLRRQAQLLAMRPDLHVRSIRGNVETRVRKVLEGSYDAAVMAAAGLIRLNMQENISSLLGLDLMLPAPGQGALAVQCRAGDEQTLALLRAIDSDAARRATTAERQFLKALGGGCSAPIAAYARATVDGLLHLDALVASPDGGSLIRVSGKGDDPLVLAQNLAAEACDRGAGRILSGVKQAPGQPARKPLEGRRIVVTRAPHQAPEFAARLGELGAEPILFPTIEIAAVQDTSELDAAVRSLADYDWVIFTSVNGVAVFWERIRILGLAGDLFAGVRVAAIGPATARALRDEGIIPDFVPDEFVAERIAEGLGDIGGKRVLLPRAELARATLAEMLQEDGATVHEISSYHTVPAAPDEHAWAQLESAEVVTFTSSSTVRNFVALVGGLDEARRLASKTKIACIGPITAETAREAGLEPQIIAGTYTIDGLVAALVAHFN